MHKEICPEFDLTLLDQSTNGAEILKEGILGVRKQAIQVSHSEILKNLIEQIEPVDFEILAFPWIERLQERLEELDSESEEAKEINSTLNKIKLNQKHYLVLSIEQIRQIAIDNQWGLCKNHDFIYIYNGAFWSEIDKEEFQMFLGEAAEKLGVMKFDARYYQFKEKLYKQFLSAEYLPTPLPDDEKVLINLNNGTFEISARGTQMRSFDRNDFLTYQLPFRYDPDATAPLFMKYLNRVLPDQERQRVLAEYIGFVFIKHGSKTLKEEKALILYGTGANGKSVFYEVITSLLGSYNTSSYSLQELTNENGYYRAMIANKLVNYASEINGKLEADMFKRMVSGEVIPARLPYGNPMQLTQYAKLIFNTNELPKDVEQTNAFFRRFLIIPFDVTIPEEEQDKNLHTKIIEYELSGVFNWILTGLKRLLQQKRFSDCEAAQDAVDTYRTESNSVKLFMQELGYRISSDDYVLIKTLYLEYREFCMDEGMAPFKKGNFRKQLEMSKVPLERKSSGNVAYLSTNKE